MTHKLLMAVVLLLSMVCYARAAQHLFPPSRASLLAQNAEIDRLGLQRIADDRELARLIAANQLVRIEPSKFLTIAASLPRNRRYCKVWTRQFLYDISEEFYMEFGQPLQVNSAVRTVRVQRNLTHRNHNAAPAHGATSSSHLAGLTVDIAKRGLTKAEITWVENYLLDLHEQVIVEEEFQQPCFHVLVKGPQGGCE